MYWILYYFIMNSMFIPIIKKSILIIMVAIPLLLVTSISVLYSNTMQSVSAQAPAGIDTFNAKGFTGQIVFLPGGMSEISSSFKQFGLTPIVNSIIAGNWSFAVSNGQLQNFKWIVESITPNGKVTGSLSINGISNASNVNMSLPLSSSQIKLEGNHTSFKGNADINFNSKPVFTDVPVVVSLVNGKLINLSIETAKTSNFFTVPLFGTITSLTH
jgi:hypothetical protein